MIGLAKILILVIAIAFLITVEYLIRKGKVKRADTYSYKDAIQVGLRTTLIVFVICILIFIYSNSLETSITLFIISIFFILAGVLRALLTESHIKGRGASKEQKGGLNK